MAEAGRGRRREKRSSASKSIWGLSPMDDPAAASAMASGEAVKTEERLGRERGN